MPLQYREWNELLAQHFFNPEMARREVILFVDRNLIDQIGRCHGDNFDGFVKSVTEGSPSIDRRYRNNICRMAVQTFEFYKGIKHEYPRFIAYLVLFVYAATIEGDYQPNAYYTRLLDVVGQSDINNVSQCFRQVDALWKALEKWSKVEKNEELGRFTVRQRGGYSHVGLVLSQTVLSERERKLLPDIFWRAGLDPTDPPTEEVLRGKLTHYGDPFLERRTMNLLRSRRRDDQELLNALLDLVLSELEEWDGAITDHEKTTDTTQHRDHRQAIDPCRSGQTNAYARVCLSRGLVGFSSSIRFKINPESENVAFPEGGLELKLTDPTPLLDQRLQETVFSSSQTNRAGWSRPLRFSSVGQDEILKANMFNWQEKVVFKDLDKNWQVILRGADVRIFLQGGRESLPVNWVEVQHIDYNSPFVVCCHESVSQIVRSWGENSAEDFSELEPIGVPPGWIIFQGKNAQASCEGLEPLTLPSTIHLHLTGGIRPQRGNYYLHFSPPKVTVEGASGDVTVTVNGETIPQTQAAGLQWELPSGLPIGEPVTIEVLVDGQNTYNSRTIQLVKPELVTDYSKIPKRNKYGNPIPADNDKQSCRYVCGAVVFGVDASEYSHIPIGTPTNLSKSIVFLGPEPGMVVRWPNENLPEDWEPVWALAKAGRDLWYVNYCGHVEEEALPSVPQNLPQDQRNIKAWKKVVWVNRKRNQPPIVPHFRQMWLEYIGGANRV